jgi:hypothetical protein
MLVDTRGDQGFQKSVPSVLKPAPRGLMNSGKTTNGLRGMACGAHVACDALRPVAPFRGALARFWVVALWRHFGKLKFKY